MIILCAEICWFFPTPLPVASGAFACDEWSSSEIRTDFYLPLTGTDAVGVKLRGGKFEIKARRGVGDSIRLSDHAIGSVELWDKWSLDSPVVRQFGEAMRSDIAMIGIEKRRWLRKYALDDDAPTIIAANAIAAEGCLVEVTSLRYADQSWWTFGMESFSQSGRQRDNLLRSAELFLRQHKLPAALEASASLSYPAWLKQLAGLERR